ncbi:retroviral-like aspartic protease family protein [Gluconobacter morbifer]|uniref:Peptidase A2 domain-containing protein n=1 Tax=Gluconobacter morbifer G707 TaxID=1088869 RepID=G6XJM9_9PROT|nr:retroviral-like aspartic protease family protein [Gluconobacter morbifer]EHH67841.1 hypothetical protein GMO_16080 [Gluconobacter morbifer G707]
MRRFLVAGLFVALCAIQGGIQGLAAAPVCQTRQAVTLPLRDDGGYLSVPATVEGRDVSLIVDTGSEGSLMTPRGVALLRLPADPAHRTMMLGPNGGPRLVPNVRIRELRLGTLDLGSGTMAVGALPGSPTIQPPILGLLGADVLADYDVEFDVPRHRLILWTVRAGSDVCRPPPLWSGKWLSVATKQESGRLTVPFTLDGATGTALLDSGARSHIVSTDFAHRLGLTDEQLGRDPGGVTAGVDLNERRYHWHHFQRFDMGGMVWSHPVLTVAPVHDQADMLLGADWFARHDIWLSYATNHVFVRADTSP